LADFRIARHPTTNFHRDIAHQVPSNTVGGLGFTGRIGGIAASNVRCNVDVTNMLIERYAGWECIRRAHQRNSD
jgi:hypothetical protein